MECLPDEISLNQDIDVILKKHNISGCEHYQVLKEFILSTILYHWEDPLVSDLLPLKEGMEEIRNAMKMFKKYRYDFKISVFGSARISKDSLLYPLAFDFAKKASLKGYKIITGAGPGLMEAANLGAGVENSFGLGLRLPYENDSKLFQKKPEHLTVFNNFYSRKHAFYKESDAIVVLPGGFGTMDELFQGLTNLQTGKKRTTPFILLDEPNGSFWYEFDNWIKNNMENPGYISKLDRSMYNISTSVEEAMGIIDNFYKVFHSYFTTNDVQIFFQLKKKLSKAEEKTFERIASEFGFFKMIFVRERYYPQNTLYVYCFTTNNVRDFVRIKLLIERINKELQ